MRCCFLRHLNHYLNQVRLILRSTLRRRQIKTEWLPRHIKWKKSCLLSWQLRSSNHPSSLQTLCQGQFSSPLQVHLILSPLPGIIQSVGCCCPARIRVRRYKPDNGSTHCLSQESIWLSVFFCFVLFFTNYKLCNLCYGNLNTVFNCQPLKRLH